MRRMIVETVILAILGGSAAIATRVALILLGLSLYRKGKGAKA